VSLTNRISYKEEEFGIESNDGLYLDCVLIRPRKTADDQIKTLRVWVPKAPLTKTSTITCARQEVISYGASGTIAHLVFDLRGTGYSDGAADDEQYDIDLASVKAWATERFPQADFGFLGTPHLLHGTVNMVPLRAGVIMENYHFPASVHDAPAVLYMSTFSTFDKLDEARCAALAKAGYEVYGFSSLLGRLLRFESRSFDRLLPSANWLSRSTRAYGQGGNQRRGNDAGRALQTEGLRHSDLRKVASWSPPTFLTNQPWLR